MDKDKIIMIQKDIPDGDKELFSFGTIDELREKYGMGQERCGCRDRRVFIQAGGDPDSAR